MTVGVRTLCDRDKYKDKIGLGMPNGGDLVGMSKAKRPVDAR
jgi:hypothetical protein